MNRFFHAREAMRFEPQGNTPRFLADLLDHRPTSIGIGNH
jgi:hypothetical protein